MNRLLKRDSILSIINNYAYDSLLPINLTYLYNFGSILAGILIIQILSGFFLASYYVADITLAFESIEYIMREVPYGYIIRYIHANGAALFFITVYLHIARTLIYGSYTKQRIITWYIGIIILLVMIITAFLGYSLVMGQMSYWAIAVITNILTVIPYIGKNIVEFIYGGYNIGNATLTRFYAAHYLLPMIIGVLAILHLIALHNKGGSNPLGINTVRSLSLRNFNPYYTIKDIYGIILVVFILLLLLFFYPNLLGHTDNYIQANPLLTPTHISPEFYLLYYYMGLRSIPNKLLGVLTLLGFILILFLLPWLHKGIINSSKFRPIFKLFLFIFFFNFLFGTYLGGTVVEEPFITLGRLSTIYYYIFFLVLFPFISLIETFCFIFLQIHTITPIYNSKHYL